MPVSTTESRFECGIAIRPMPGEIISGDRYLIRFQSDRALFAVIDGAGHGSEAASAATLAASILETDSCTLPGKLLSLCHEGLRSTRGAAISLASVGMSDLSMSWAGVGNVETALLRKNDGPTRRRESLLLRNGVVGYEFSSPRVSTITIEVGDLLIFATDGIRAFFLEEIRLDDSCQTIADTILARHAKGNDDALVLVIRVLEGAA